MAQEPQRCSADNLDDRQIRAIHRLQAAEHTSGLVILQNDSTTLWMSKRGNRVWSVERMTRNRRGTLGTEYRCSCADFQKNGRIDCEHIFAERLRRGEVVIDGEVEARRMKWATGSRRPPRKRLSADGRAIRSIQRAARVEMDQRVPELLKDLVAAIARLRYRSGTEDGRKVINRAAALALKLVHGKSYDAIKPILDDLIATGALELRKTPHQNTMSKWMNDAALTPILEQMLAVTAKPFRALECAAIADSSKMSQMKSAHSRWVEYGDDQRENATWMKLHSLVGVESLICMSAIFSGTNSGNGAYLVHDVNFLLPLVEKTQGTFALRYVLADKAYLSEQNIGRLHERGIKSVIPVKKRWDGKDMKLFYEAFQALASWYDERQADFHEIYRLRPKVESYFSLLKSVTAGFCWSRGRPRKDAGGQVVDNSIEPCTAWKNETLCKLIYVNLRITVQYELSTGYRMNYLSDTFFPEIPAEQRLIA